MHLTVEQARGLLIAAPQNDDRYYLNAVLFDFKNGRAVVTDGHALVAVNLTTQYLSTDSIIIRREDLAEIAKGGKKTDFIEVDFDGTVARLQRGDRTIEVMPIDAHYPDYERIMPKEVSGELAQFNPALVATTEKALRMVLELSTSKVAQLSYNGSSASVLSFTGYGDKAIAVVMPMRVKAESLISAAGFLESKLAMAA